MKEGMKMTETNKSLVMWSQTPESDVMSFVPKPCW